jgi:hypothetical protein
MLSGVDEGVCRLAEHYIVSQVLVDTVNRHEDALSGAVAVHYINQDERKE